MINLQSLFNGFRLIIFTKNQLFSAMITDTLFLRWHIYYVICSTTTNTCSSSTHSVDDILVRNIYINCIINLLILIIQCIVKSFCLWNGTWKTIKDKSFKTILFFNTIYYKINNQFVWYKLSCIHVSFCFLSEFCIVLNISTENISCRNMRNTIFL